MVCPSCSSKGEDVRMARGDVIAGTHGVRRWYHCKDCGSQFSTLEFYENGDNAASRVFTLLNEINKNYSALGKIIQEIAKGQKIV
ncbi:MAG: hypothetical protein AB1480_05805 [Nitrospirota bacterium]